MRTSTLVLALIAAITCATSTSAQTFTYKYRGKTLQYSVLDKEAKTATTSVGSLNMGAQHTYAGGDVEIPSTVEYEGEQYTVTELGEYSFRSCLDLTSVIIPPSVTKIGPDCFSGCTGLKKAACPSHIADTGFIHAFPYRIYCIVRYDAEGAILEDGFIFGPNKESILYVPWTLTGEYEIPASVTSIGEYAFSICESLAQVVLPPRLESIGGAAFFHCDALTSISIPASVQLVGSSAFTSCGALKKVEYTSIEHMLEIDFHNSPLCNGAHLYIAGEHVTDLVIPDGTISIGARTFSGCSGLESVTIPESVKYIGEDGLRIYSAGGKAIFASIDHLFSIDFEDVGANPLCSLHHLYIDGKEVTEITVPEHLTTIGNYILDGATSITAITLPPNLTVIGSAAFADTGISSITLPPSLTEIGASAFTYCQNLSSITIPDAVTTIGNSAFSRCEGLTSVTLGSSVESIGNYAFNYCWRLKSINFPSTLAILGEDAFKDCNGIKTIAYDSLDPISAPDDTFSNSVYNSATLYVPDEGLIKFVNTNPWKKFIHFNSLVVTGAADPAADRDYDSSIEVFNLSGAKVADSTAGLTPGTYITRRGSQAQKISVR